MLLCSGSCSQFGAGFELPPKQCPQSLNHIGAGMESLQIVGACQGLTPGVYTIVFLSSTGGTRNHISHNPGRRVILVLPVVVEGSVRRNHTFG